MKRFIQVVFLAGSLVFSAWAAGETSITSIKDRNRKDREGIVKKTYPKIRKNVKPKNRAKYKYPSQVNDAEDLDESEDLAETEAEGVGKCPHCGVKTAEVEREEDTNPDKVAAQVQPSKRKKATKPSREGTEAIR